jgi:tRNA(Ile)-lysidine synthase
MRQASGSGARGLAGMPALAESADMRLLRPLLTVAPGRLRATLRARGVAWVEDPSNADPAALRARLRAALADPDGDGDATRDASAQAVSHGRARAAEDRAIACLLASKVRVFPTGHALLAPGALPPAALAALLRMLAGAEFAPSQVASLAAAPRPATLGGVRLLAAGRRHSGWLLVREAAAMAAPVSARDGAVWDGRFRLFAPGSLPDDAMFGALGEDAAALRSRSDLPSAVLRTLPCLRVGLRVAAVPHLGVHDALLGAGIRAEFMPGPMTGGVFAVAGGAKLRRAPYVKVSGVSGSIAGSRREAGASVAAVDCSADHGQGTR